MLDILKALADPVRLRLLALLDQGELTVSELTEVLGMGQSRISRHLKILLDCRMLKVKRQGTWNYYRLSAENTLFGELLPLLQTRWNELSGRRRDLEGLGGVLEERRRRSQHFFDRHAGQWDELARRLMPTPDYLPELLEAIPETDPILEVGIGTGRLLAELSGKGRRVIGIDNSPAMLAEARQRLAVTGIENPDLRLGEMGHLPLSDGEATCVVLNMVLHHAPEPATVLAECARVLAGEGSVVIADLLRHGEEGARERLADQWLGFEEGELRRWMKRAGLACDRFQTLIGEAGSYGVLLLRARKA